MGVDFDLNLQEEISKVKDELLSEDISVVKSIIESSTNISKNCKKERMKLTLFLCIYILMTVSVTVAAALTFKDHKYPLVVFDMAILLYNLYSINNVSLDIKKVHSYIINLKLGLIELNAILKLKEYEQEKKGENQDA